MSPSRLSKVPIYYERLESDIDVLMDKLYKRSKSFKLFILEGRSVAYIAPKIDGHKIELTESAPTPQEAVDNLDTAVEKAGLYDK